MLFAILLLRKRLHIYSKALKPNQNAPIISVTTFPNRITTLWMMIESLFRQTIQPEKIIVTLSIEEFPNKMKDIPSSLTNYIERGVEFLFVEDNLKAHKKYYYTFQTYPNRTIITVDDDCYYWEDTIERLMRLHERFPDCVCANIAASIQIEHFHDYNKWKRINKNENYQNVSSLAIGCGGVLYPKEFRPVLLFDKTKINLLCPYADDLWLKANELICNTKVIVGKFMNDPIPIYKTQKHSLNHINNTLGRNSQQWKQLDEAFNLKQYLTNNHRS